MLLILRTLKMLLAQIMRHPIFDKSIPEPQKNRCTGTLYFPSSQNSRQNPPGHTLIFIFLILLKQRHLWLPIFLHVTSGS